MNSPFIVVSGSNWGDIMFLLIICPTINGDGGSRGFLTRMNGVIAVLQFYQAVHNQQDYALLWTINFSDYICKYLCAVTE